MSRFNTGNPIGSNSPLDRDDNTKNYDEAINSRVDETWIDRFGVERPSLALLEQMRDAANAIVGGGDDITQAWRKAISSSVVNRIADEPVAYTASLAGGNGTARPPLMLSGDTSGNIRDSVGASGRTFVISAPGQIALRSMIPVSKSSGLSELSILTGVRPKESIYDGDQFVSIAWYDKYKNRLTSTPTTDYFRGQLGSASREFMFSIGAAGTGADIEAPVGAMYAIPFLGLDGTTGEIFASVLSASFVNPRLATTQSLIDKSTAGNTGVDLRAFFKDGVQGSAFDLANSLLLSREPVVGEEFPVARSITSDVTLRNTSETYRALARVYKGSIRPGGNDEAPGQLQASEPLIQNNGSTVVVGFSLVSTAQSYGMALSQHAAGQAGRFQVWVGGRYTGAAFTRAPGQMGVFIEGASGGSGINGQPAPGRFSPDEPVSVLFVLKDGPRACEFWVNGELADKFTKPAEIYQTSTRFLNNASTGPGGDFNVLGGRLISIEADLNEDEKHAVGNWLAASFNTAWERANDTDYGLLNAVGAHAFVINEGGPRALMDYPDPIFSVNPDQPLYPASMTKTLTSMVLLDNIPDTSMTIEMRSGDETGGSGDNIDAGDILTIDDALYNMLLPSSNVTTTVVARTVGELILGGEPGDPIDVFVGEMNKKAAAIGMTNSNFENASGLARDAMVTTARDMARLCASVLSYPDIYNRWGKPTHELNIMGPNARTVEVNHSIPIIDDPEVLGGKTGTVSASIGDEGYTRNLMYWMGLPNGNIVAAVVMNVGGSSSNRYIDAEELIEWLKTYYRWPISDISLITTHPPTGN